MGLFQRLGAILFLFSIFIIINSRLGFTGAVVGVVGNIISNGFAGLFLLLVSGILFFIEGNGEDIKIKSAIKKHKHLCDLAEEATNDQKIQRGIDHLAYELAKGNLEVGLGKPGHIEDTNIFYLRARNGARLYYRQTADGYEIVGKSKKGKNQEKTITALKEYYEN